MLLAPAVLQFFLQAMQSVSQSIDSLPAGTQEPPDLLRLTVQNICKAAADAVTWGAEGCYCCDTNRKGYAQQRKQLMQSAHCLQATCLLMLITTYSTLPPLQDVNSSSRLSDMPAGLWRSCLCTKTPLPVPEGWPYAVRHHGALPMPHTEMLRLLGCSSKVCMWAAAILMPPDKEHLLLCAGRLHVELAKGVVDRDARLSSIFQGPAAQQPQPHTRQQQRQGVLTTADALHTLVPCVMLHWVAKYPVGTPDLLYCGIVTFVWSGAISGVSPISIQYEEMSRQQQQQHVLPAGFVAGSMVSVQQLLREQLAEALQAMQTLVSVWQGSINTAAASSSRTAVAGPPITDGLADAAAGMVNALKTLAQVLFNDSKLRDMEAPRQGQLETNRLSPQHAKLAAAALRSQAVQLCLGLEHFVRVQAVAAAAPTTLATLRGVGEQDNWPRDGQLMLDTTNPVNCLAMEELLLVALHEGPGSKAQNHLLSLLASILKGCQTQQNQKHVLSGQFAACFVADEVLSGMQCKGLSAFAAAAAGSSSWEQQLGAGSQQHWQHWQAAAGRAGAAVAGPLWALLLAVGAGPEAAEAQPSSKQLADGSHDAANGADTLHAGRSRNQHYSRAVPARPCYGCDV